MLVLTIKRDGEFVVGGAVLQLLSVSGKTARIGVTAPMSVQVRRIRRGSNNEMIVEGESGEVLSEPRQ